MRPALFLTGLALNAKMQMTYRINFFLTMGMMMMFNLAFPLVTFLIYLNSNGFPGWNFDQILLFQGFVIMVWGLQQFFLGNVSWELNRIVREGQLDKLLVLPMGPFEFLMTTEASLEVVPEIFLGIFLVLFAMAKLGLIFSLTAWVLMILFLILALIFLGSLNAIQMALVIRFVQIRRLGELLRVASLFGQYPANIYSKAVQTLLIGAIPFALIAFYPSSAVLGRITEIPYIAIISTFCFAMIAVAVWKNALKKYTSAGG